MFHSNKSPRNNSTILCCKRIIFMLLYLFTLCNRYTTTTQAFLQPHNPSPSSQCHQRNHHLSSRQRMASRSDGSFKNAIVEEKSNNDDAKGEITIRKVYYEELKIVAEIIMKSFYDSKTGLRGLFQIAELNRLQNNFPYAEQDIHQMVVAISTSPNTGEEKVVGFVDIDARPCRTKQILPRPYLSDLAVDPHYRRQGIARALVEHCEHFIQNIPKEELWIRVQESNVAAISMYEKLDYDIVTREEDPQQGTVLVLHKEWEIELDNGIDTDDDVDDVDDCNEEIELDEDNDAGGCDNADYDDDEDRPHCL